MGDGSVYVSAVFSFFLSAYVFWHLIVSNGDLDVI